MPKKLSENDIYRNENYPNLYPCMECHYWKCGGGGSSSKKKGTQNVLGSLPMCTYVFEHGQLRGCEPDLINRKCEKFLPK